MTGNQTNTYGYYQQHHYAPTCLHRPGHSHVRGTRGRSAAKTSNRHGGTRRVINRPVHGFQRQQKADGPSSRHAPPTGQEPSE